MVRVTFEHDQKSTTYECEVCVCSLQNIAGEHEGDEAAVVLGEGTRYETMINAVGTLWHIVKDMIEEDTARMMMGTLMTKALKDLMKEGM